MGIDRRELPATLTAGVGLATGAVGVVGTVVALGWMSAAGGWPELGAGLTAAVGGFVLGASVLAVVLGVGLSALGAVSRHRGWVRLPAAALGSSLALVVAVVALLTSAVLFEPATTVFALGLVFFPPVGLARGWLAGDRFQSAETEQSRGLAAVASKGALAPKANSLLPEAAGPETDDRTPDGAQRGDCPTATVLRSEFLVRCMSVVSRAGRRIERAVARYFDGSVPPTKGLPRYVAPLPEWLEDLGLRLAWPIAIVNLVGTLFGFWYYAGRPPLFAPPLVEGQLAAAPVAAWPLIPDSPVATMLIGLSLVAWRLDLDADPLHALAFFGCIKLGLWTPFVQLVINGPEGIAAWLYWFLVTSHLAMVAEAFVIHRYARFGVGSVAIAAAWYGLNDLVDYFLSVLGGPHHTWLRAEFTASGVDHALAAHDVAAAWAILLTFVSIFLALATRVETLKGAGGE
jgi:uncharacterized membrane protein YpjA